MTALAVRSPEWLTERRAGISSTDLPIILGLSPYRSEASLAREKLDGEEQPTDEAQERRFRFGLALEAVIRAEDELEHGIRLRRINGLIHHRELPWAITSLDFERVGERTIVEAKSTRSGRWDDGLPQDVEAQVRWQMGVARYPRAHVAALRHGSELTCFDVEHDEATFTGLVRIAEDFRARLAAGGPFAENAESVKRRYPSDSGAEMAADAELTILVRTLVALREQRRGTERAEADIETAIKSRMGAVAILNGEGFHITWKRTKDVEQTDWRAVADGLLRQLPETERTALVGLATTVRPGFRPFRVVTDKED